MCKKLLTILLHFYVINTIFTEFEIRAQAIPPNPCSNIFEYVNNGGTTQGLIELYTKSNEVNLLFEASLPLTLQSSYFGAIELINSDKSVAFDIRDGRPLRYIVKFPNTNAVPMVTGISLNGQQLCSGPSYRGTFTNINLKHHLKTSITTTTSLQQPTQNRPTTINNYQQEISAPVTTNVKRITLGSPSSSVQSTQYRPAPQQSTQYRPASLDNYQQVILPPKTTNVKHITFGRPSSSGSSVQTTQNRPPQQSTQYKPQQVQYNSGSGGLTEKSAASPENVECGRSTAPVGLVVGGKMLKQGEWPWLAALFYFNRFHCGGSIISRKHILSAAHCIEPTPEEHRNYHVIVGGHNLDIAEETQQKLRVKKIYVHKDWSEHSGNFDADIAIILVTDRINFNNYVVPICLPFNLNDVRDGEEGYIAGWGKVSKNIKVSTSNPQKLTTRIVSYSTCAYESPSVRKFISRKMICAGDKNGSSPCTGDSGGGLLVKSAHRYVIRGIVSASTNDGEGSCNPFDYAAFTDVSKFLPWIQNILNS